MSLFIVLLLFIAIAAVLAWFLIAHDRGEREPVNALWLAVGLGLAGGAAAGFLESRLIPPRDLLQGVPQGTILVASLAVGVIEESCKFLPLALVLYRKRYFNEHTDGVIYFALAGVGFGLPENILYALQFGAKVGLLRVMLTPFFHAATTGLVGYFLAKRKLAAKPFIGILPALAGAMILHGLYDFGLISGSGVYTVIALVITLATSGGLFVAYQRARQLDQDRGLSVVGHNSYCRSCGFANPRHYLYCVQCGRSA